ncbi:MAG: hypothetical protein OHK0046_08050 [Anaerolineae bacterium]
MKFRLSILTLLFTLLLSFGLMALSAQETEPDTATTAAAVLQNVDGNDIGTVSFSYQNNLVLVTADLNSLPPGFHGFHIHTTGSCEDSGEGPFTAAGPHYAPQGNNHPDHAGDLPVLLVNQDGTAYLSVRTDRFMTEDLFDEDGSAIIVHALPDNYANIPERYGGPDAETLDAGDSGDRIACGVIEQEFDADVMATPSG